MLNAESVKQVEAVLKKELLALTLKSVNEVLREYQDTLERSIVNVVNGNMTPGEMSRATRAMIRRLAPEAYQEGMKEGGIRNPEEEMEDEDDEAIALWERDQLIHLDSFIEAIGEAAKLKGDERTEARSRLFDRAAEWVESMHFLGQKGYLSAKGNLPLTYDGDDGEESCEECQRYKGQRHRKSWWEKRGLLDRPNDKYTCGRFKNCHHHFFDDEDNVVMD